MLKITAQPSQHESLLARAVVAIDQVANPLERAVFRGDLAELFYETTGDRRCLALLLLLTRVERALTEPVAWTETLL